MSGPLLKVWCSIVRMLWIKTDQTVSSTIRLYYMRLLYCMVNRQWVQANFGEVFEVTGKSYRDNESLAI
jgi:hypothetical protein